MRSTYRHDSFSDWGCGVKLAVWICSVIGPLMVIGGVVFLVMAVRDPAAAAVKTYNRNVDLWTEVGGGFLIFQEAFMGPDFTVQVSPATYGVNSTTLTGQNLVVELASSSGVNLLANQGDGYTTYQQSLFFAGNLPIFAEGDGPDWIAQPMVEQATKIPFTGYTCQSITVTMPCAEVSPPPPPTKPPPPPTLTAYFLTNTTQGINPYLLGKSYSAPKAVASPPPPPPPVGSSEMAAPVYDEVAVPPAYTATLPGVSGRKLLVSSSDAASAAAPASSNGMCTLYYRQMQFLTELVMIATEPETCGGGYCDNNTWAYTLAPTCSESYTTINVPITAAQYSEDTTDGAAWCTEWWTVVPSYQVPSSTMYLRSSTDPYLLAGEMTNCSYAFDQAGEEYANMGFFFLVPGLAVSLVAYFCLEGVCTPRMMGASGPSSAPLLPKEASAPGLPPYGTTTAVEMIGRGMLPTGSWAAGGAKQA